MSGTHQAVIRYAAPVVKACSCGRTFTLSTWEDLPDVGTQPDEVDASGQEWALELRLCSGCKSTLAVRIPVQR